MSWIARKIGELGLLLWKSKQVKPKPMIRDHVISAPRLARLHPAVRESAEAAIIAAEAGFPANIRVRIVQGLRTIAEQNRLYAQGRTAPGPKVTNAPGGRSYHNYGLAVDFAILYDRNGDGKFEELSWDIKEDADRDLNADWLEVVRSFEKLGWEWGGKWSSSKDYPHLERKFGFTTFQLLERVKKKKFLPGTDYVDLN